MNAKTKTAFLKKGVFAELCSGHKSNTGPPHNMNDYLFCSYCSFFKDEQLKSEAKVLEIREIGLIDFLHA